MLYEERYLQIYSMTKDTIVVIAEDHEDVKGVVTGLPLLDSMGEVKSLFMKKSIPADRIFYLGEIILLPEHKKKYWIQNVPAI